MLICTLLTFYYRFEALNTKQRVLQLKLLTQLCGVLTPDSGDTVTRVMDQVKYISTTIPKPYFIYFRFVHHWDRLEKNVRLDYLCCLCVSVWCLAWCSSILWYRIVAPGQAVAGTRQWYPKSDLHYRSLLINIVTSLCSFLSGTPCIYRILWL